VLLVHVFGGLLGGTIVGVMLAFAGSVLWVFAPHVAAVLRMTLVPGLAAALGLADLGILHIPVFGVKRQTPKAWLCFFGPAAGVFTWGFDLGTALTTKLPLRSVAVLPVFAVLSGSLFWSVAVMATFGLFRTLTVAVGIVMSDRADDGMEEQCSLIGRHISLFQQSAGLAAACLLPIAAMSILLPA
jgi:hypothetical protein